jgi:uncharacterized protein (DUF4415 family)
MKKVISDLTLEQQAELEALAVMSENEINIEDIPEVTDWSDAQRGMFYCPEQQQITLCLDVDLIDWFKQHPQSKSYQTNINQALREYMNQQKQLLG